MFPATLIFLLLFHCFVLHAEQLKVPLRAKAAILINADTGAILYEKEPHSPRHPASITKIATIIYALEKKAHALNEPITALSECLTLINAAKKHSNYDQYPAYILEHDGTKMGLKSGEVHSLESLMHGMMLVSGNDASNVVAKYCSGNIEKFMEELNLYLKAKGIRNTNFCNPHGLHHPNHVTTAFDMAHITRLALKNPKFREIVKKSSFDRPASNLQPEGVMVQHNKLLRKGKYFYPKAIGVKTGYVGKSGFNLVAAAEDQGRTLIAVLLGYENGDQRFSDAIALFETAFKEKKVMRTLFTREHDQFSCEIPGAKQKLSARLKEDVKVEYYPAEEPKLSANLKWFGLSAPLKTGAIVGELKVLNNESFLWSSHPIYAEFDVEKSWGASFADGCKSITDCLFRKSRALSIFMVLSLVGSGTYLLFRKRLKPNK